MKKKVGIMGGTFDPVHHGHLVTAEFVREEFMLDKILFIPVGQPHHKINKNVTGAKDRLNMLHAAVRGNAFFEVCTIEIDREGYTYTVDTLEQLKATLKDTDIYFIVGADVINELTLWKNYEAVFKMCEFIAVMRPGTSKNDYINEILRLSREYNAKIHMVDAPLLDISSTTIRKRVHDGKSIKYLVPSGVEETIKNEGLYMAGY
ncbi:MAG TPA: nicotinate-nucleotide adenylyltransferase [Clostridia bacterium]